MAGTEPRRSVLIQRTECILSPLVNLRIRKSLSCRCGFVSGSNDLKILSLLKADISLPLVTDNVPIPFIALVRACMGQCDQLD